VIGSMDWKNLGCINIFNFIFLTLISPKKEKETMFVFASVESQTKNENTILSRWYFIIFVWRIKYCFAICLIGFIKLYPKYCFLFMNLFFYHIIYLNKKIYTMVNYFEIPWNNIHKFIWLHNVINEEGWSIWGQSTNGQVMMVLI
jgi:hypothetical protein